MMDQPALIENLDKLLKSEYCSLARHLGAMRPYLSPAEYPYWHELQYLSQVSIGHSARLSALLAEQGEGGHPQGFDLDTARFHYLGLGAMLEPLIEEKQEQIESYRKAISHCESPRIAAELQSLLADNEAHRAHLDEIRQKLAVGGAV